MPVPETIQTIPVAIKGFDWTAAGAWTAAFTLFGVLIKQYVPLRKVQVSADTSLREDLMKLLASQMEEHRAEVAQLKADTSAERLRCAQDMAELRQEAREDRARLEGEIKALRSQLLQLHQSTGAAIQLGGFNAPEAEASMDRSRRKE